MAAILLALLGANHVYPGHLEQHIDRLELNHVYSIKRREELPFDLIVTHVMDQYIFWEWNSTKGEYQVMGYRWPDGHTVTKQNGRYVLWAKTHALDIKFVTDSFLETITDYDREKENRQGDHPRLLLGNNMLGMLRSGILKGPF